MNKLTFPETVNLKTFSDKYAVGNVYNKTGFTKSEEHIIEKYFRVSGKVLDLGCGTGRTTKPFQDKGYDVVGVDISESMIEFARKKYKNINFMVMDACNLEFESGSFDYVFFSFNGIDCIYPCEKRIKCLKEIFRVLKKNGLFIFSSHNILCLPKNREIMRFFIKNLLDLKWRVEDSPTGKLYIYYGFHFAEKRALERAGFKVLEVTGKGHNNNFFITFMELSPHYIAKKR